MGDEPNRFFPGLPRIPQGFVLGRRSAGEGPVELIRATGVGRGGDVLTTRDAVATGGGGGGGGGGGDCVLVGHAVASGGATASLTISGIPNTGHHLLIRLVGRTTAASTQQFLMRFNGDTGTNYDYYVENRFGNASVTSVSSIRTSDLTNSGVAAGYTSGGDVTVLNYADPTFYRMVQHRSFTNDSGSFLAEAGGGWWKNLANAISSVTVFPSSGNFVDGTTMSVYMLN